MALTLATDGAAPHPFSLRRHVGYIAEQYNLLLVVACGHNTRVLCLPSKAPSLGLQPARRLDSLLSSYRALPYTIRVLRLVRSTLC